MMVSGSSEGTGAPGGAPSGEHSLSGPTAAEALKGVEPLEAAEPDPAIFRPTLERYVPGINAGDLAARVTEALNDSVLGLPYRCTDRHFLIWIPDRERHLWSPWLHLDVEDVFDAPDGSDAARLFGRFSPAPSLWTGVMFGLLTLAVAGIGSALFAYSQWIVGQQPWALWATAVCAVGILLTISVSRIGQARARYQMQALVELVDRCA